MEVLAVCLPAFLFAIRGDKVAIHAIEILFAQPFEANVKWIFHHRQRRLRHAEAQALRQMVGTDHMAFIFQHPAGLLFGFFKQADRQVVFKGGLRVLILQGSTE